MKGVVFTEINKLEVKNDLPKPELKTDEVLVKVKNCGICGSDVESYETGALSLTGIVLGHEFSGEIIEIGGGIKKLKIGDRVTANPFYPCKDCYMCNHGLENLCKWTGTGLGFTNNGALAEYIAVRADRIHKLPNSLTYEEGMMVEPIAVTVYAVKESGLKLGENVTVFGAGTIGLLTIQVLRAVGASKIFVIEPIESKQKKALEVGADKVFIPKQWGKINKLTDKIGPDHIFDCAGIPETFMTSMQLIKKGGMITVVGIHADAFEMKGYHQLMLKNINIRGTFLYHQENFVTAINLLEKKINVGTIITKRIKLDDVPNMFEILSKPHDEIKVLVEID